MGLFGRGQQRAEHARNSRIQELQHVSDLYVSRDLRKTSQLSDWTEACRRLRESYTQEEAALNAVKAKLRVQYLEVREPYPALEDFLPDDMTVALFDTAAVMSEAQRRFEADRNAYEQREKLRLNQLEAARAVAEEMEAAESVAFENDWAARKAERRKRHRAMWPESVELDDRQLEVYDAEELVDIQNTQLEERVLALSNVLKQGLEDHASILDSFQYMSEELYGDYDEELASMIADSVEETLSRMWVLGEHDRKVKVAHSHESRLIAVEYQLPDVTIVPRTKSFRYVKSTGKVIEVARSVSHINALYADCIAQLTLLCLGHIFEYNTFGPFEVVVFNGVVETTDPRTGRSIRPCLITVRVTRKTFAELDLAHVNSQACLKHLSAGVSRSATELVPVRPVLEISMVDARFVTETDALSALDDRPNLMDLSFREFESLIQNLFTKMGLEARQTRPSRDGGVDCVAFDTRPIFGGKVVIQAKRYKNTVGVSAVRDLYGTLQNEGASKGILVTTSGYGAASFEFAQNKPIELIDGANLLYLLAEHTGVTARIEPPEDWRDPAADSTDFGEFL
ncbi:restriction endonuclease [Mycolicibacterium arabiense]|nr:restriction endonuclease [Mycolicibacterium arabiense]MCV7374243.1 restriction endonuclease [Mycolicibacterium arabiense]